MIKVNGGEGTGSGFLIQGGYIVTDNHVVTLDGILKSAALQVYFSKESRPPAPRRPRSVSESPSSKPSVRANLPASR